MAAKQLGEITECPICMNTFTDPKMLPCIHTFCFECLKHTGETAQAKPGDKMPCPVCRKEFTIPTEGMAGFQRNFFMENLIDVTNILRQDSKSTLCDICKACNGGDSAKMPTATARCLECRENLCDRCSQVHQVQKVSKTHKIVKIGSETEEEITRMSSPITCTKHIHKSLDYYCAECKRIVCVSCFVESHKLHDGKDVATVDDEFRQTIEKNAWKILTYADEMLSMKKYTETRRAEFLKEIVVKESAIHERNQKLKDIIDEHTKSLLDELFLIKSNHLKEIENEMEEIDRYLTMFKSFETYCTELRSKGSASDICSSVDGLIVRADDLGKDHEAFIGRPRRSVEVSFQTTDIREVLQKKNDNIVGQIKETSTQCGNSAIIVGLSDCRTITKEVVQINMHRQNLISNLPEIPTAMKIEATATVYCNTVYVTGIGDSMDEIWKFKEFSGWKKCASLIQGRRRHSAAFIGEVLYICGGFVDSDRSVLDSVEAYNTGVEKCTTVGKLVHCVQNSGNCVPFKTSLYIFGGGDKDYKAMNHVQVYDTKQNTCTLLSEPMPRPYNLIRAALQDTSVILVGCHNCFIFNFEMETWQEREQFKTDVVHFGLVLENERVFVIGGGNDETDKDGKMTWKFRDDVRYVPLRNLIEDKPIDWKIHATLTQPAAIHAYEKLNFFVL